MWIQRLETTAKLIAVRLLESGRPERAVNAKARSSAPLWVCEVAGGPPAVLGNEPGGTSLGLEEAHRELKISPAEFDEVAAELGRTLDHFGVPEREKGEVLAAFAAHKGEVTEGYSQ